jgi:ADP-ribose pyrophosphatase YjhB (NUDIX family)
VPDDHLPRFVCDNCSTIHYQNPNIVTGALPIWEDKVLLCKRGIEPRKGFWNVPGGYLENGESVEEGAIREVWEEAMTKITILNLHMVYSIPRINQVYMHFLAQLNALDFQTTPESTEVQLFSESEIPWKDIAFPSSKFTLKHFFEDRRKGVREVHLGRFDFKNWVKK